MKVSLKLQDHHHQSQSHHKNHHLPPLLVRAKLPITIFDLPFLSHFSTTTAHPSDLSLSLSTNFLSGPSLKLSYATAATAAATLPLSLTLKSGTGLFGSPNNSPLVISAHFSFNPSNPNNPNPTFSLLFKPKLGSFYLRKSTFSNATSEPTNTDSGCDSSSFAFVPLEQPPPRAEDLSSVEKNVKDSIFKGIRLTARTEMPLAKRVELNFRWRADFAEDRIPVLRINKIGIFQRVDDVLKDIDDQKKKKKSEAANDSELEVLKGMCLWMKRELDSVMRMNREMKCELEEMRVGRMARNGGGGFGDRVFRDGNGNKAMPPVESSSGGFEKWRSKRNDGGKENGNGNGKKEEKNNACLAVDVENELQRAIKAAAGSSS